MDEFKIGSNCSVLYGIASKRTPYSSIMSLSACVHPRLIQSTPSLELVDLLLVVP